MNHLLRSLKNGVEKPVEALVTGTIPKWVKGSLYRNGPGKFEIGDKKYKHLFDGLACVHKFTINDGKVSYFNKFLETKCATKSIAENRLYPVFGTSDVCSNIFGRVKTIFERPETFDNTNVTVIPYGPDQLYAMTETNLMCKIDPNDLSVLDTINITKMVPSASSTIAHPHAEKDGSWLIYGMNLSNKQQPRYEFIRYKGGEAAAKVKNPTENGQVIASIPTNHKTGLSYCHSFGMSKNFIIFLEQSMIFDLKEYIVCMIKNKPFSDALKMHKDLRTRIHLINRHTGEVVSQKFTTDPLFVFHHINAYETKNQAGEDTVLVDISAYDAKTFNIDDFSSEGMFSEKMREAPTLNSVPSRIEIPISKKDPENKEIFCKLQCLNPDVSFELPVINYAKYNGEKYRYMYGVNYYRWPFSIVKVDAENPKAYLEKKYSNGDVKELPSEPVFVANPDATSEDDGVLLVMVLCDKNDFLSVLDAKTLEEIGRAELPSGAKASFTFHGIFDKRRAIQN